MTPARRPTEWSASATAIARRVASMVSEARASERAATAPPATVPVFSDAAARRWSSLSTREQRLLMLLDAHVTPSGHALIQRLYAAKVLDGDFAEPAHIDALLDRLYELKLLMVVRLDAGRKCGGVWIVATPRSGRGSASARQGSMLSVHDIRREIAAKVAQHMIAREAPAPAAKEAAA